MSSAGRYIPPTNKLFQALFVHPTDDYDFVIELSPSSLTRYLHNVTVDQKLLMKQGKYANKADKNDVVIMPGFDPAQLLFSDLQVSCRWHNIEDPSLIMTVYEQRTYADTFKIFFDPFGGDKYGGVWDPTLKDPRAFRVLGGFSSIPVGKVCSQNGQNSRADSRPLTGR